MTPQNKLALSIHRLLRTRFVADTGAWPLVFDLLGLRMTRTEARRLLERLILIHHFLGPGGPTGTPAGTKGDHPTPLDILDR